MNTKTTHFLSTLVTGIVLTGIATLCSQADEPQSNNQLKDPALLAATIAYSKDPKPVIFNIGSVQQIKGAISIGPLRIQENLDKFKQQLAKLPKDKEVIIYCGCCPLARCPNIGPAFELLKKMKFTNAKRLNLPSCLQDDWISKGYPLE